MTSKENSFCQQTPTSSRHVQPGSSGGSSNHKSSPQVIKTPRVIDQFYKLVSDPFIGKGRKTVYRTLGQVISENPEDRKQFDWKPSDGNHDRRHRKQREPPEILIPIFKIDANTVSTPPRREVCIIGLNDNINEEFLTKTARKYGEVLKVYVYYHPKTRKYLGIGLIVFRRPANAAQFCQEFNGKSLMGNTLSCVVDPWAALVSHHFEIKTQEPCPTPHHLRDMDENDLIRKREQITSLLAPLNSEGNDEPKSEPMELETNSQASRSPTNGSPFQNWPKGQTTEERQRTSSGCHVKRAVTPYEEPPPIYERRNSGDTNRPSSRPHSSNRRGSYSPPSFTSKDMRQQFPTSNHEYDAGESRAPKKESTRKRKWQHRHSSSSPTLNEENWHSDKKKEVWIERKYYKREEQHTEIVSRVTITKKKTVKRSLSPVVPGAEAVSDMSSSSQSSEEKLERKFKTVLDKKRWVKSKSKGREDLAEHARGGHHWTSSESDSDENRTDRHRKNRKSSKRSKSRAEYSHGRSSSRNHTYVSKRDNSRIHESRPSTSKVTCDVSSLPLPPGPPPPYSSLAPRAESQVTPGVWRNGHGAPCLPLHMADFSVPPPFLPGMLPTENFGSPPVNQRHESKIDDFLPRLPLEDQPSNSTTKPKESLQERLSVLFKIDIAPTPDFTANTEPAPPCKPKSVDACEKHISHLQENPYSTESDAHAYIFDLSQVPIPEEKASEMLVAITAGETLVRATKDLMLAVRRDLNKILEKVTTDVLNENQTRKRHEQVERNKQKALESLRATIGTEAQNKNEFQLNTLVSPLKNNEFSLPKMPSFRMKKVNEDERKQSIPISHPSSTRGYESDRSNNCYESISDLTEVDSDSESIDSSNASSCLTNATSIPQQERDRSSDEVQKVRDVAAILEEKKSIESPASSINDDVDLKAAQEAEDCSRIRPVTVPSNRVDPMETGNMNVRGAGLDLYDARVLDHCYPCELGKPRDCAIPPAFWNAQTKTSVIDKSTSLKEEPPVPAKRKYNKQKKLEKELKALLPPVVPSCLRATLESPRPPKIQKRFSKRTTEEEQKITNNLVLLDEEDQKLLRKALESQQPERMEPKSFADFDEKHYRAATLFEFYIPFVQHDFLETPALLDKPSRVNGLEMHYDDPSLLGVRPLPTGCAKTKPFEKLTIKEKRSLMRRPDGISDLRTDISREDETVMRHLALMSREQKQLARRLLADTNSDLFKANQLRYRKKMIKFARSKIHGWGLYAMETIAPDDMIVEYIGEKIRSTVCEEREVAYQKRGIGDSYLFRIDENEVIDATRMGNFARFINHSCQPNCYARVVTVDGDKRIVIYSKVLINKGDEITYDYKFPIEDDKQECLCGAPNCRGTLN